LRLLVAALRPPEFTGDVEERNETTDPPDTPHPTHPAEPEEGAAWLITTPPVGFARVPATKESMCSTPSLLARSFHRSSPADERQQFVQHLLEPGEAFCGCHQRAGREGWLQASVETVQDPPH